MTIHRAITTTGIAVSIILFIVVVALPWSTPYVLAFATVAVAAASGTHGASVKQARILQAKRDTGLIERAVLEDKAWRTGTYMIDAGTDAYHDFLEVLCRPDIRAENIDQALELAYCFSEENVRKAIQWILPLEETEAHKRKQEAQQKLVKAKEIQSRNRGADPEGQKDLDAYRGVLETEFKATVRAFYPDWPDHAIHIAWVNARKELTLKQIADELGIEI